MAKKEEFLPDREFALDLLRRLKIQLSVRRHSEKVAEKAIEIAKKVSNANVDLNLIEIGAILHDIGRIKTHALDHGIVGGIILRNKGLPSSVSRICETHILGGLDKEDAKNAGLPEKDFLPETIEEKIICLADKNIAGTREVTIEERFNRWFQKYGKSEILLKSKIRIEKIQKEIESLMK